MQEDKPAATEIVTTCFLVVLCIRDGFKCQFEALDTLLLVDAWICFFLRRFVYYFII